MKKVITFISLALICYMPEKLFSQETVSQKDKTKIITKDNIDKFIESIDPKLIGYEFHQLIMAQLLTSHIQFITPQIMFTLGEKCVTAYHENLTKKTYGGFMRRSTIVFPDSIEGRYRGLIVIPCLKYKADGRTIDSLFFAYKTINDFTLEVPYYTTNENDVYYKTSNHYNYNGILPATDEHIETFLKSDKIINGDVNSTLLYSTVRGLSENFRNKYTYNGPHPANLLEFGFFLSWETQKVLDQEASGLGLRVHFGFDRTESPNRIRMTLNEVDANGDNMIFTSDLRSRLILQRSWPPYPPSY